MVEVALEMLKLLLHINLLVNVILNRHCPWNVNVLPNLCFRWCLCSSQNLRLIMSRSTLIMSRSTRKHSSPFCSNRETEPIKVIIVGLRYGLKQDN